MGGLENCFAFSRGVGWCPFFEDHPMDRKLISFPGPGFVGSRLNGDIPFGNGMLRRPPWVMDEVGGWCRSGPAVWCHKTQFSQLDYHNFLLCIWLCAAIKLRYMIGWTEKTWNNPIQTELITAIAEKWLPQHRQGEVVFEFLGFVCQVFVADTWGYPGVLGKQRHVSGELLLYASLARLPLRSGVRWASHWVAREESGRELSQQGEAAILHAQNQGEVAEVAEVATNGRVAA